MITTLSKSILIEIHDRLLTTQSPFSQKNIQECRCGTESCRGVLGPKPKKPVEERSITSAFIAGTKRKLQDFLGSNHTKPESSRGSPAKRKVYPGKSVAVKTKNMNAAMEAAREQAEIDAAEHSRQKASREDRASKRSTALTISKRLRPAVMRRAASSSLKSSRTTTVSLQRKVVRPGALKTVNRSARLNATSRRSNTMTNGRKGLPPSKRPSTPTSSSDTEDVQTDQDASPNITPASLRSASKDGRKRASNLDVDSQDSPSGFNAKKGRASHTTALSKFRSPRRKLASTPRGLHDTGAGVKKPFHPAQSRPRTMRGRQVHSFPGKNNSRRTKR